MKVERLEGLIGVEILGVDITAITDDEYRVARKASNDYAVVVFRDQEFSPQQHVEFTKLWGPLEVRPLGGKPVGPDIDGSALPEGVVQIVYENYQGISTDQWHSDASYLATPPAYSMARLRVLPGAGGDTMFANCTAAYNALSEPVKEFLDPLVAVHRNPRNAETPEERHPVVITHPDTGELCLYVNPMFTTRIEGLTALERDAILGFLYAHQEQPQFVYRHRWREGDLVIWDNRCTHHYAIKDYGPERRVLQRTTTVATRPARAR
jgi:taurine dioxygenase